MINPYYLSPQEVHEKNESITTFHRNHIYRQPDNTDV